MNSRGMIANYIIFYVALLLLVTLVQGLSSTGARKTISNANIYIIDRYRETTILWADASGADNAKISIGDKTKSLSLLGLTTLLWGSYGMGMKFVYDAASPPKLLFNFCAASASATFLVLFSAFLRQRGAYSEPATTIVDGTRLSPERLAGLELGAYLFIASVFQIYSLGLTTVGHSAFIIQLATVFAPLLQAAIYRTVPSNTSIISTILAFCGVLMLTSSGLAATTSTMRASVLGDSLSLVAAVIYGLHVVRLGVLAPKFNPMVLANMKEQSRLFISLLSFLVVALLPLVLNRPSPVLDATYSFLSETSVSGWLTFVAVTLWQGVLVTAVPTLLQSIGQSNVPVNTAAIIYATTPLWSAVLEFLFMGEAMSSKEWMGSALLLLAVLLETISLSIVDKRSSR